jgi:hypothetical protein
MAALLWDRDPHLHQQSSNAFSTMVEITAEQTCTHHQGWTMLGEISRVSAGCFEVHVLMEWRFRVVCLSGDAPVWAQTAGIWNMRHLAWPAGTC